MFLIMMLGLTLTSCSAPEKMGSKHNEINSQPVAVGQQNPNRQAGSWTMVHYIMAFEGKNLDKAMAGLLSAGESSVGKKDFGGPLCLLKKTSSKDNLFTRIKEGVNFGPEWKIIRMSIKNNIVDFYATMEDPQAGRAEMTITGILTDKSTDLVIITDSYQPAPGKGHIHTVMKQENSRIGECIADQDVWQ
ncbi:hypothetical protein LPB140_03345 [Sphingorhabdus lutea]|uniref:Uncharacterized protein n=2 Tax=Sphingorhabdus lutea TaxID=1913578 RepID=A0A1L3JA67_9SPHN|nr:hypothetical protein LPB140_03345 [Sphingorhabdus lutea]